MSQPQPAETANAITPTREQDFPEWYQQVVRAADLKYNVDFRSVYATVLEKWLKAPSAQILGKNFPLLPIV